jgi:histidine decarboxylase
VAAHLTERLNQIGVPAWRHRWAFTVVFPEPPAGIMQSWPVYRDQQGRCHLLCMPGVTRRQVDAYVEELSAARRLEAAADLRRISAARTSRAPAGLAVTPCRQMP